MQNDYEIGEPENKKPAKKLRSRIFDTVGPFVFALPVLVLFAVVLVLVIEKTEKKKKAGVMTATYAGELAREITADGIVKPPAKFKHVIFRLGDAEIFRFTYKDGGAGQNYSFEVREGGS